MGKSVLYTMFFVESEPSKQAHEEYPPITLSPLAKGDDKFFEPGKVHYRIHVMVMMPCYT